MDSFGKLSLPFFLVFAVLALGTVGYHVLYSVSFVDSLYMTVTTVFTVGYGEVFPLDTAGKFFTIFLIFTGVGSITLVVTHFFQFMLEGRMFGLFARRKMEKTIAGMRNHFIVCGFGRVGEQIALECRRAGRSFVVVDHDPEALSRLEQRAYPYVAGNASSDEILLRAGVERAMGLVAASDSDPDNVLITLSARMLNPRILIVSRAGTSEMVDKLEKAGANRVLSPYVSAGQKIAAMLIRPAVHDYLEIMASGTNVEFQMEELELKEGAELVSKTVQESAIRKRTGVTILAIKKPDGRIITNPPVATVLESGDRLILVGTAEQLKVVNQDLVPTEEV